MLMMAVKTAVTVTTLALLLFVVDWRLALQRLTTTVPYWLVIAICLNIVAIIVSAWRWQRLVAVLSDKLNFKEAVRLYWIGYFFSTLLPSNIGGDVVRLAMARRVGSVAAIFSSLVVERVTGFVVLICLSLVSLLLFPPILEYLSLQGSVLVIVAGVVFVPVIALLLYRTLKTPGKKALSNSTLGQRIAGKVGKIGESLATYRRSAGVLWNTIALSFVFYAVLYAFQASLLMSVGANVSLWAVIISAPLVMLVSALPISINGIGVSEGVFVAAYAYMGVQPEAALAAAALRRLVITGVAPVGLLFWLRERRNPE
jgi:uncharacterized protein (TIRG00374 family)